MRKFVRNILLFILPFVLTAYALDGFISCHLKQSNSFAKSEYPTWNAIMDGKLNARVLVYGSSRAWVHFNSRILEDSLHQPVYNLGMDGHTFNLLYLRHLLAFKNNPKPDLVILSVDIGTINNGSLFNADQFLPYMLWNRDFYNYMSKYEGFSFYDYNIPLLRYYGNSEAIKAAVKLFLRPQNNPVQRYKGFKGRNEPWNGDFDRAKKTMEKYVAKPDSSAMRLLDDCLRECHNQNVKVVLVYSPYYIEGQQFISNQQMVMDIYRSFSKKYDFPFLDYTADSICYDKRYFYNASHMNATGADKFTRELCADLNRLGLLPH
ncbi:MAG: hypothetical protein U0T73_05875 [Chitinophagales bacterium]